MSGPPLLRARDLGHRYPGAAQPSLSGLGLELRRGELVLLSGPTGSGKSTALRLMAGLLVQGREGEVELLGADPAALGPGERARRVGFVAQQPHDQLVTGALGDEVAFGPECLGQAPEALVPLLRPALARAGLPLQLLRPTSALSGGQTQRLAVAAALASGAPLLLLDEPLAWLDPEGARELVLLLRRLADEGHGVLIVEHRLSLLRGLVDRELSLGGPGPAPPPPGDLQAPARELVLGRGAPPIFVGRGLGYSWPGAAGPALAGVELELRPGERLVITGPNGCGKSTLLALMSGRRQGQGHIQRRGRVVEVPQDPDLALFCESVRQELELGAAERGHADPAGRARALAQGFDLEALLDRAPQSLSRGQRLRVAVAAALSAEPDLLLLDEPAAGQDPDQVERLMGALCRELGPAALVWVSHDLELAARWSTRQLRLEAPEGPADKPAPEPATGLDPRAGLLLVLCAGLLALALEGPLPLGLLCLLCGASLGGAPALRPHLRGLVLAVLGLMWSTALSQGLFYGEQPRVALLHLGPLVLWREGLWHGLVQSLRFIAVTLAGVSLALRCPSDRLYLGLMGLGIHPGLSFLAATSLRSLPLVAAELASVRGAWASRARPTWHRHPWAWLQVELALLRPALARSLRRARVLAESLDMRGFDPTARRSAWRPLRWGWRDSAALAPALLLTLGILGARGLYLLYVAELYYHPSLRLLLGLVRRWL